MGSVSNPSGGSGKVSSVNGRTGAVTGLAEQSEVAELQTDPTLPLNSDARVVSEKAVKTGRAADKALTIRSRDPWRPEGTKAENFSRISSTKNLATVLTSGTLYVVGGLLLPEGEAITRVDFYSATTAAVEPTHQWACLLDTSRKILTVSADKLTEAWGANTKKSFTLPSYSAPSGEFKPVYAALLVTATTTPTLRGVEGENTFPGNNAPMAAADSNTGLTTPLTAGETAAAFTAKNRMAYVTVG